MPLCTACDILSPLRAVDALFRPERGSVMSRVSAQHPAERNLPTGMRVGAVAALGWQTTSGGQAQLRYAAWRAEPRSRRHLGWVRAAAVTARQL